MNNDFFRSPYNIREYLVWALSHTRSRVAILLADSIAPITWQHADGLRPAEARGRLWTEKRDLYETVQGALEALGLPHWEERSFEWDDQIRRNVPSEQDAPYVIRVEGEGRNLVSRGSLVDIVTWPEAQAANRDKYTWNRAVIQAAMTSDPLFRKAIEDIVVYMLTKKRRRPADAIVQALSAYVIDELAVLVGGCSLPSPAGPVFYDLLPYPDDNTVMQQLIIDLQAGKRFPDITKRLLIPGAMAAVVLR